MSHFVVVMTSCINPEKGAIKVKRNDPRVRLQDYKTALRFWLHYPDKRIGRILYIDNSGYPLDELQAIAREENPLGKQVEFISMDANDYPADGGYGYAELHMLDIGLPQSNLLRPDDILIKVTGRLYFPNLSRLLNHLPERFHFAVDARRGNILWIKRAPRIDTQLFLCSLEFYLQHLVGSKERLARSSGFVSEYMLYHVFEPYSQQPGGILRWPVNCDPIGYGAFYNHNRRSIKHQGTQTIRTLTRILTPEWWF